MPKEKLTEIIPKAKPGSPNWIKFAFYFSLLVMIAMAIVGLMLANRVSQLEKQKTELSQHLNKIETQRGLQKQLKQEEEEIKMFQKIWTEHQAASRFFPWLEKLVHSQVQLTSLTLSLSEHKVDFSAQCPEAKMVEEQMLILSNRKDIGSLKLSNVSLGEEQGATFGISFSFPAEIISFK